MRGRTLDNAFIILDEAQNATDLQLKMFLTRIGASAKAIITGDLTQIDLRKIRRADWPKRFISSKELKAFRISSWMRKML
ncbi:MAG: PhoH family protein [Puia sp.]